MVILEFSGVLIGYASGRFGHILGGHLGSRGINIKYWPHHWVFGVVAVIIGLLCGHELGAFLIAFGLGHIISDLNDLLKGRVFDANHEPQVKRFWGID